MEREKVDAIKLLESGKTVQLKPQGFSMYPILYPGRDEAVIEKADISSLKRGDVILYRRDEGKLVLHRIWKIKNGGFYTVGDNQCEIEGPLRADQIKGKLIAIIRKGHRISVKNPVYVIVCRVWLILRPLRPKISKTAAAIKRAVKK